MPANYTIDADARLVRSRAWGILTFVEAMQLHHAILADPSFVRTFNELFDFREVETIALSTEELRLLAKPHLFAEGSRRAFLHASDRPVIRGIVRMFEAFRDSSGGRERIRAFHDLDAAMAWIEGRQGNANAT